MRVAGSCYRIGVVAEALLPVRYRVLAGDCVCARNKSYNKEIIFLYRGIVIYRVVEMMK
jgi:hypothetical protein